jgi:sulfur carrier protein
MKLIVNGEPREREAADIERLFRIEAEEAGIETPQGIAIALNGRVVRRRDWAATPLADGDRVEIVRAMQGG